MKKMRIAAGGIHIESSTFTPYLSGEKDFHVLRGEDLRARYPFAQEDPRVEFLPLIHAGALPGGVVRKEFAEAWKHEFFKLLKKAMDEGGLDGLLFDIHGAMSMEGSVDAEGDFLSEIRKLVGGDVCISLSMDLHGNVSDRLFKNADLLTCYRTAPHVDQLETRKRAFQNLVEIIEKKRKDLVRVKVDIPMLLPGEKTSTEVEPGKSLYGQIPLLEKEEGILDCALWMGFPWADQPRCHAAVVATGYSSEKVEEVAMKLASKVWESRDEFKFVAPALPAKQAIQKAFWSERKPFFLSDTGDNPGAGGSDDMVIFLNEIIRAYGKNQSSKKLLYASIMDEETVRKAYRHSVGENCEFYLGGKIDPSYGGPLPLIAEIKRFYEDEASGPSVILSTGNLDVVVTSRRHQFATKEAFASAGVEDFADYDIIVVKMGYLEPDLKEAAADHIMALTPGAVNQKLESLPFHLLDSPLYPWDKDFDTELIVEKKKSKPL